MAVGQGKRSEKTGTEAEEGNWQVDGTEGVQPTARRSCEVHKTENRELRDGVESRRGTESRRRKLSAVRSATCQRVLPAAILRRNNRTRRWLWQGEEGDAGPGKQ